MPELPEVETVRCGLLALIGKKPLIKSVKIRNRSLRYPVPTRINQALKGKHIVDISRRAKYLIWNCGDIYLLNHLGMTGSWRLEKNTKALRKHDHAVFELDKIGYLIYHDPRRFGMIDVIKENVDEHKLLAKLGPEPLDKNNFNTDYLYTQTHKRKASIKQVIMDQAVVVGVGNIYASESLHRAGIDPRRSAMRVSKKRIDKLVQAIRHILGAAIKAGGSTISDFRQAGGSDGYFQHHFQVYEREGETCKKCGGQIKQCVLGQRSSYWCNSCQS